MEQDIRYLTLLSREFPSVQSACAEIIKLEAIRSLPKGTEHFMSDIHGEHEAFLHILNNASGAICEKIDELFESTLTSEERRGLAVLIYYPVETLHGIHERASFGLNDWYRVTLHRLIEMARYTASKYSRSKVRKALPQDFAYIMEELLNPQDQHNKHTYYDNIIRSVIDTGMADTPITELCTFIKRMAVATLHIVGDIFHSVGEFFGVGNKFSVNSFHCGPAVVDDDILIPRVAQSEFDEFIGGFQNDLLVDERTESIP